MATSPELLGGGFIEQHEMLSPPLSSTAASSISTVPLPRPRSHPLKPGGPKESSFISFVDREIMQIERRYAKRVDIEGAATSSQGFSKGFRNFGEAAKEIEKLLDLIWVSGTPSLQIPYLLSLALLVVTYLPNLPPSPRSMFHVLDKLDLAFASLIQGRDFDTDEPLPGFAASRGVSGTEKVRIKSLVERTRIAVVQVLNRDDVEIEEPPKEMETDDRTNGENELMEDEDEGVTWSMEIAKVYERTVVELGDTIGNAVGMPPPSPFE